MDVGDSSSVPVGRDTPCLTLDLSIGSANVSSNKCNNLPCGRQSCVKAGTASEGLW